MTWRMAAVMLAIAAPAWAQVAAEGNVMGSVGRGAIWMTAGGEAVVNDVVGIGGELGVMVLPPMGLSLSPRITVRVPTQSYAKPFLSAGWPYREWAYGRFNGFYAGGGVDLRSDDRRAIRIEVRRHVGDGLYYPDAFTTVRAGMTFR